MKKPINGSVNPREMDAVKLSNYIRDTHHAYLRRSLQLLRRVFRSIGKSGLEQLPLGDRLKVVFTEVMNLLDGHLDKEQDLLFPYIRSLAASSKEAGRTKSKQAGLAAEIHHEHERTKELIGELRKLTDDYTPPAGSLAAVKLFYAQLFNLEQDVQRHIYIEEHMLFPRMAELGASMAGFTIK